VFHGFIQSYTEIGKKQVEAIKKIPRTSRGIFTGCAYKEKKPLYLFLPFLATFLAFLATFFLATFFTAFLAFFAAIVIFR